jgi:hypothetical protein
MTLFTANSNTLCDLVSSTGELINNIDVSKEGEDLMGYHRRISLGAQP